MKPLQEAETITLMIEIVSAYENEDDVVVTLLLQL